MNLPPTSFEYNRQTFVVNWSWEPKTPRYDDPYMLLTTHQCATVSEAYALTTAYTTHVRHIKKIQPFETIDGLDCKVLGVKAKSYEVFRYNKN